MRKGKNGHYYDPFADRVLFPIHNHNGKLVGLTGRVTATNRSKAKYNNSAESPIFKKRDLLYGLRQNALNIGKFGAILVEGNWDVLTMYDRNIRRAVASMGTAVTREQLQLLRRYTDKLTILMDGDEAGKKAALATIEIAIQESFEVSIATLPDSTDPDDFLREAPERARKLLRIINNASDGYEQLIEHHLSDSDEDRGLQAIAELLASIKSDYRRMLCSEKLEAESTEGG